MKVTIIGSGNSACAQASKLCERGHEVTMVKTSHALHEDNYDTLVKQGGIYYYNDYLADATRHFAPLRMITRDIAQGVRDADVILVLTQSIQHPALAKRIAPYLHAGQIVWLIPGYMGSIYFQQERSDLHILE